MTIKPHIMRLFVIILSVQKREIIMIERRRFSRIIYRAPALMTQGSVRVATTIQDLSLHGILLLAEDASELDLQQPVTIDFPLPESEVTIGMVAQIISIQGDVIRVKILNINIESIIHLRRLVELNVGDDELLHRELSMLSDLGNEEEA
jgi:c-di-GMP-binding flagellar brake protein YcgR